MTNEEVMTRKIQRKRRRTDRRQSSSLVKSKPSLPLDLALDILLKLPLKSVMRFRCVSKLWSSITTIPYFKKSFETQSSTRPRLLVCFGEGRKSFVFSISQDGNECTDGSHSFSTSQPIDSYHMSMKYPKHRFPSTSVHGLICFRKSGKPIVWNPTTRKVSALTIPEKSWNGITVILGYDPIEGKHKVVCMPFDKTVDECRVLTLGSSQESWRRIQINHTHHPLTRSSTDIHGRCINGVIYYYARIRNDWVIMSFDVRSEQFDVITLPWGKTWLMIMASYQGKLVCVGAYCTLGSEISMWVLEDAKNHQWSNHVYSPLSHYGPYSPFHFKPTGITDDGELIYAPYTLLKSFNIIYVDPKKKTTRIVEYKGIGDDDFRQRNGLGDRPLSRLQFFPNHIETLTSL